MPDHTPVQPVASIEATKAKREAADRYLQKLVSLPTQAEIVRSHADWLQSRIARGRPLTELMDALEKAGEPIKREGFRKAVTSELGGVRKLKQTPLTPPKPAERDEVNLAFVHHAHGGVR